MKYLVEIKDSDLNRLRRIQQLRNCSEEAAVSFALVCGWMCAERSAEEKEKKNGRSQS